MRRPMLLATLAVGLLTLAAPAGAVRSAADPTSPTPATIAHMEPTADGLQVLVSVPDDAAVRLDDVRLTVDGHDVPATASSAGRASSVRRTTILAIDTSNSMTGPKIAAARAAAHEFLATVPDDVYVGIVSFAGSVVTDLAPTRDRARAGEVVDDLTLSGGTHLYDGVVAAADAAGTQGQRSLLVLSDGADSTSTSLDTATGAVDEAGVLVDVVTVGGTGDAAALTALARAGRGRVLPADPAALASTFEDEAQALARQVLVTARVPAEVTTDQATVAVTLHTAGHTSGDTAATGGDLTASAFGVIRHGAPAEGVVDVPSSAGGFVLPTAVMYAGVAALALGLVALLVLLVPRSATPMTAEERVTSYTAATSRLPARTRREPEEMLAGARTAAADILKRNATLEARIAARLDAAGSQLKPAEWLLVHAGIAVAATLLGLLLTGGSLLAGLLLLGLGALGPWLYLGVRRTRRRAAFNAALPDTLQLVSGSLSAGLSLAQAIDTVVRDGVEPVAGEFRRVLVETRLGVSLEDALDGVAKRFESKDFDWVVMAIRIQRQVGGNLAELLDTVAGTMREREYLRRQVSALSAEGRLSAWVLGLLPPLFMLYLALTNWDYVSVLFTDARGLIMLAGGTLWLGVGVVWMSRLVKVEV